MKEYACQFGEHRQLAGIVTEPPEPRRRAVCLFITAGLAPKFGPFRLYALLARHLAQRGFLTMRFDLGGIGDSGHGVAGVPLMVRTNLEIKAALDFLCTELGAEQIILCGSCSGAESAFRYAELDARVGGVVMVDPFSYRTRGWAWRNLVYRLTRRALRALRLYKPFQYKPVSAPAPAAGGDRQRLINYHYLDFAESSRIVRILLDRHTRLHFVYTGAMRDTFNHRGQLRKMFRAIDFKRLVTVDYFPHSEHSPVLDENRRALIDAVGRRLVSGFPTTAGRA